MLEISLVDSASCTKIVRGKNVSVVGKMRHLSPCVAIRKRVAAKPDEIGIVLLAKAFSCRNATPKVKEMDREERIRARARTIWEEEGRPSVRHLEHWERACREIDNEACHAGCASACGP